MALEAVLVGAGHRGHATYGDYALRHPDRLRFVALAEPDAQRRARFAAAHGLPRDALHADWRPLFEAPPRARVAVIASGDAEHVGPALAALARGYDVLLEKPIALAAEDCVRVVEAAERADRALQIAHPLRYAPFYGRVHELVAGGAIGELVHLDLREHVATWHMTHSYVRGKFRNLRIAAPFLIAKSCHDLDLLLWLAGGPARRVACFGSLSHFRAEAAPAGAPARCSDGCPVQASCPHDAERFYLSPDAALARLWPWSDVSPDPSREARRRALETGRYGRCVYHCDNDVVDHQVVTVELGGGATATLAVHGFASEEKRTLRASGTRGELRGVLQDGVIEVSRHGALGSEREQLPGSAVGHFGGDEGLLDHFTGALLAGAGGELRAATRLALASHLLGFSAEEARRRGITMDAHCPPILGGAQ